MDPVSTFAALASLSTIVKNIRDILNREEKIDRELVIREADGVANRARLDTPSIEAIARISDMMRRPLDDRIARARRKIQDRLDDPHATWEVIKRIINECEIDICWYLTFVKRFNDETWPTEQYEDLWDEHGCENKSLQ
jgi:hypothetical protein